MPVKNGVICDKIKGYAYQTLGHYADQCPGQKVTKFSQTGIVFSQGKHRIRNTWLFLDTCSSNSVPNNPRTVKNMEKCKNKDILTVQTNGGINVFSTPQVYTYYPLKFNITQTS